MYIYPGFFFRLFFTGRNWSLEWMISKFCLNKRDFFVDCCRNICFVFFLAVFSFLLSIHFYRFYFLLCLFFFLYCLFCPTKKNSILWNSKFLNSFLLLTSIFFLSFLPLFVFFLSFTSFFLSFFSFLLFFFLSSILCFFRPFSFLSSFTLRSCGVYW